MHLFLVMEVVMWSSVVFVAFVCRRRRRRHFSFMHSEIVLYRSL